MSSYWVNFARSGDPNGKGPNGIKVDKWPVYDGTNQSVMVLGDPPEGAQSPSEAQLAFFRSYFDKLTAR
jgi:para-nitrobenzyl esterase